MTNINQNNKLYFASVGLLCALTYLLNYCPAVYQCALVFTTIALTVNALTYSYGKSKALKGLAFAALISFTLLWKLPYYIDGKIINGLVLASLTSVMMSIYWSTSVFQKLCNKLGFVKSNALSLITAAVIDGVIMTSFFTVSNNFSYAKILNIFVREISYKAIYALLVCAGIAVVRYLLGNKEYAK